jgi:hypothetical protein
VLIVDGETCVVRIRDEENDTILAAVAALGSIAGTGEHAIAVTVTAGGVDQQNVLVRAYDGSTLVDRQTTDTDGECTLQLDAGTYTIVATKQGLVSSTSAGYVVTVPAALSIVLAPLTITDDSDEGRCTGHAYCYDEAGELDPGAVVYAQLVEEHDGDGRIVSGAVRTETADANGLVVFPNLWIGASYDFRYRNQRSKPRRVLIDAADVVEGLFPIPNFHG